MLVNVPLSICINDNKSISSTPLRERELGTKVSGVNILYFIHEKPKLVFDWQLATQSCSIILRISLTGQDLAARGCDPERVQDHL